MNTYNGTRHSFRTANHGNTAQDTNIGMRTQKRFLDIQSILQEYQGSLARIAASGESRADEVDGRGKDIRHVLGAKHHIIEWLLDTLPNEIRDTVADFV